MKNNPLVERILKEGVGGKFNLREMNANVVELLNLSKYLCWELSTGS